MEQATEAKPDRHVLRMLAQQIAVAQIDGLRDIERAARRALRAYKRGNTSQLDADALDCIDNARNGMVRILVDDEVAE